MTKSTILIVDDIEANRQTMESLLDDPKLQLHYAADGPTALAEAANLQPDLILLDVMMPGMDGFEVCARLRADPRTAEVPVLMVTSLDDRKSRLRGIEAGADDFVTKPFDRAELRARINGILRLNRFRRMQEASEHIRAQAALIDLAPDAIIVCDLSECITYWNSAAERLYGWPAQEAIGKRLGGLLSTDETETALGLDSFSKDEWRGEVSQITRGGKNIVVESRRKLLRNDQGQPQAVLMVNTDLTERKQLEEQFLRLQRMESIGKLAGGIAHDMNNVLLPIMMSLEVLKLKLRDHESEAAFAIMSASAQRAADMVRQILSFASGVAGRRVELQVRPLVEEIEQISNDTFLKHIQVETNVAVDIWSVLGDPTQLHQVLLNLCVNARDAMPGGGKLTISAKNVALDEQYAGLNLEAKPGPYVVLQVKDTGSGMSREVAEKIFDPFYTTKEVGKGTGLGLSSSLGIVKSHGGFIRVASEPGRGTTFDVYLPALKEISAEAAAELAVEMPRGHGELILVVDDELAVRQITQQTLNAFGYRVILASDGAEAVAIYVRQGAEIAAVLTDMKMPIMDGPSTIQALSSLNPAVRIIGASGLAVANLVAQATQLGVKHFLEKPYSLESLLKVLKDVLSQR